MRCHTAPPGRDLPGGGVDSEHTCSRAVETPGHQPGLVVWVTTVPRTVEPAQVSLAVGPRGGLCTQACPTPRVTHLPGSAAGWHSSPHLRTRPGFPSKQPLMRGDLRTFGSRRSVPESGWLVHLLSLAQRSAAEEGVVAEAGLPALVWRLTEVT